MRKLGTGPGSRSEKEDILTLCRRRFMPLVFFVLLALIRAIPAAAQSTASNEPATGAQEPQPVAWQDRPGLLDGPGSVLEELRQRGIDLSVTYTEFGQGLVAGDGNNSWRLGGKMLGKGTLDGAKLHLWKGFFINFAGELNNGANVNGVTGTVLLENTALAFPQDAGTGGDFSLNFTQKFGKRIAFSVGKFDMINAPSRTPILGGGGLDTFWNIAFAAPPSGVLPPYVTGGNVSINTKPATITLMLYDPTNAQQTAGLKGWGTQGITGRISARFPAKIRSLPGYHTFTFASSTQTGLNLEDIPQLLLPPESRSVLSAKSGYYFGSYSVQQYFHQNKDRDGTGWGMFAQLSYSDSNPNPLAGNVLVGLGGTGILDNRPLDRAGIGYFHYYFSDALKSGLENTINFKLGNEQGMEVFYNFAVVRWFRVAADFQLIQPGNRSYSNEFYAGISSQIRF
ncbi:MAG: carbohydrate porin [Candidatus Acidiferrum sp.]